MGRQTNAPLCEEGNETDDDADSTFSPCTFDRARFITPRSLESESRSFLECASEIELNFGPQHYIDLYKRNKNGK